jgi:hypothetical protein
MVRYFADNPSEGLEPLLPEPPTMPETEHDHNPPPELPYAPYVRNPARSDPPYEPYKDI